MGEEALGSDVLLLHTCEDARPVQMGNCRPNHPLRHPLICFPHANVGFFADGFNIFVASPFYLKQNKRPTMSVGGSK